MKPSMFVASLIIFVCSVPLHSEPSRHDEILQRIDLENSILEHELNVGRTDISRDAIRCIAAEGVAPQYQSFEAVRSRCIEKSKQSAREAEEKDRAEITARDDIVRDWSSAYIRCALSLVRAADDGISDAQTVAFGLHSKCRGVRPRLESVMSFDRAEQIAGTLRPKLVEIVLTRRAVQRK